MSHPDVSMVHDAIIESIGQMHREGETPDERRLAGLLLDLYQSVKRHPSAIAWANNWAQEVLERGSEAA